MAKWWRAAASASGGIRKALLNPNSPCFLSSNSSYHTIQAVPREHSGSRLSSRERAQGKIPAIVFSQDLMDTDPKNRSLSRKFLLTTEKKQIQAILNSVELPYFCSTVFPLQIRAGSGSSVLLESGNVLPMKIHRDKETGKILNLVFVWADEGTELKVDVPVVFKGEDVCPGLKKGGYLKKKRTSLRYSCLAEHVPAKVEVDVSNLDIGDRIYLHEVQLHPAMKLLSKSHEDVPIICKVVAAKSDEEDGRSAKSEGVSSPTQQV